MEKIGNILKMRTELNNPVSYFFRIGDQEVYLNDLINQEIQLKYFHRINCIKCGKQTDKSFAQGFCYPCFISAPETEECVLRPELCRAHEGEARDMEYAKENCLIEQYVYLANTSGLKVGVTRSTQIPTRWIDQGAIAAIKLASTPNRYSAGLIEVALKKEIADKTNWRKLLNENNMEIDLVAEKNKYKELIPEHLKKHFVNDNSITIISYPIEQYPDKVKSLNFDKQAEISGILKGIKGQYLLLSNSEVINIRKFAGYYISISY